MEASTTGPRAIKLSTLEQIVVYTNSIGSGSASGGTLKHQKLGEITYPFHIWVIFFSCVISKGQCAPNPARLEHTFSLDAKNWIVNMDSSQEFIVCVINSGYKSEN